VSGDRRDVDDVTGLLPLHVLQDGGNAVKNAFDVHVDRPVPVGDLEPLQERVASNAAIEIQRDSDAGKESNWLPAPDGPFNLVLRC
jgi:hypothetical protein